MTATPRRRRGRRPAPSPSLAHRLAGLGYSPIPLEGKVPAKGKASLGWPRRRDPDPGWIAEQVRAYPGANVGIVCGRVVAVDIDVLDPDLAHRLDALAVALLGEGPLRIGQSPKRLRVYRLAEPLPYMAAGCGGARVEILGPGRQFAAYGTHPDTGRPYSWPDGDLTDTALEDLPEATPEALRRFIAEAAALLPRREDAPARAKTRTAAPNGRAAAAHGDGGGGEIVRDADGRVVDGRDAHLSQLAFHAVHDAIARGAPPDEAAIAAAVWERFREDAALDNAKGSGRAWSERDALMKVRDKLRLHSEGRLPGREGDAPAARVPPFHPLPTAAAAEARAEVRRQVQGFLARTLDWHEAEAAERIKRQQAARAAAELAAQERDAQVGAELAAQLGTGTAALVAPEHAGLAVEVAAGKTTITCAALPGFTADAKARRLPDRVLFLVPTHKLGGEILGILEAQGLVAAAWRGRAATNPDTGQPMCANLDAVGDAIAVMQDVERTVCGKPGGPRCPFFDECPYQHQKAAAGLADVVVAAHETMLGQLPSAIGEGFAVVIADEGWWQDGLERARPLAAETLRAGEDAHPVPRLDDPDRRDDEATEQLHALRRKMAAAVEASPDGYLAREALLAAGLTAADCADGGEAGMAPQGGGRHAPRHAGSGPAGSRGALRRQRRDPAPGGAVEGSRGAAGQRGRSHRAGGVRHPRQRGRAAADGAAEHRAAGGGCGGGAADAAAGRDPAGAAAAAPPAGAPGAGHGARGGAAHARPPGPGRLRQDLPLAASGGRARRRAGAGRGASRRCGASSRRAAAGSARWSSPTRNWSRASPACPGWSWRTSTPWPGATNGGRGRAERACGTCSWSAGRCPRRRTCAASPPP